MVGLEWGAWNYSSPGKERLRRLDEGTTNDTQRSETMYDVFPKTSSVGFGVFVSLDLSSFWLAVDWLLGRL